MQGLEPFFQWLRIRQIWPHLKFGGTIVDLGCDREAVLLHKLSPKMSRLIGLDLVVKNHQEGKIEFLKTDITKKLPLKNQTADCATMLAVLEHLENPESVLKEVCRVLKPGGIFLATVPSPESRFLLDILAPLHLVRQEMVDQHENYFTHRHLFHLIKRAGFKLVKIESWELGFNTFVKAIK